MKSFLPIVMLMLFVSCASNQHAYHYKPNIDISQVPNPEAIHGDPYVLNVDDFTNAYNHALSEGYILLGISVFQGELDHQYNALQLAREKGANLVIKSSRFSHTEYNTFYLPLTNTSTSSTVGYASGTSNIYNRNHSYLGSVQSTASGTATTTTQNTNWVPMQTKEQIYSQATALFIKANIQYKLGAYYRDLNLEEQKSYMTNKGVVVTHVIKRSPAYSLDLVPGDVILEINSERVSDSSELKKLLSLHEDIKEIKVHRAKQLVYLKKEDDSRAISSIKEPSKTESSTPTQGSAD